MAIVNSPPCGRLHKCLSCAILCETSVQILLCSAVGQCKGQKMRHTDTQLQHQVTEQFFRFSKDFSMPVIVHCPPDEHSTGHTSCPDRSQKPEVAEDLQAYRCCPCSPIDCDYISHTKTFVNAEPNSPGHNVGQALCCMLLICFSYFFPPNHLYRLFTYFRNSNQRPSCDGVTPAKGVKFWYFLPLYCKCPCFWCYVLKANTSAFSLQISPLLCLQGNIIFQRASYQIP